MRQPSCRPKHRKHRHFVLLTSVSKRNQAPVFQDAYLARPPVESSPHPQPSPSTGYALDVFILRITPTCAHADLSPTSSDAHTKPHIRQKKPRSR
ncbi:hypothetical protein CGRA01v4_11902 [Colletotrichum graminicola]|nr:hypothetical protein CGRA01v4_11902 [Colletotrichum graminicola]